MSVIVPLTEYWEEMQIVIDLKYFSLIHLLFDRLNVKSV